MRHKQLVNDSPIDEFSAEVVITAVIYDLNCAFPYVYDSRIKGASAHVIDQPKDIFVLTLEAIRKRSSDGFLQKRTRLDSRECGCASCRLGFRLVKCCWDGYYGRFDVFAGGLLNVSFQTF